MIGAPEQQAAGDLAEAQRLSAEHATLDATFARARISGDRARAALLTIPPPPHRDAMADVLDFPIAQVYRRRHHLFRVRAGPGRASTEAATRHHGSRHDRNNSKTPCPRQRAARGRSVDAGPMQQRLAGRTRRCFNSTQNIAPYSIEKKHFHIGNATSCQLGFLRGIPGWFVGFSGSIVDSPGSIVDSLGSFAGFRAEMSRYMTITNAYGAYSGEDYDK